MYGRCTCKSENTYSMNNVCPTNKGSPVHVAPACVGSREGSDHFGSIVHSLSLTRDLLVTRQQLYHCAKAPLRVPNK